MSGNTHTAVVTVAARTPLETMQVPTTSPEGDEVRVKVEWTCSTPLDLHQADSGLLVKHPLILGDGAAGTVVDVGPTVKNLKIGDKVFGFVWRQPKEKAHQEFIVAPEWLLGIVPAGVSMQAAVTVPNNLVTAFHTFSTDLDLPMPWPKPDDYVPPRANDPILIWGAASSVGQYGLQVLKYYGYKQLVAVASPTHHDYLKKLGATYTFSYREPNVVESILKGFPQIPLFLDCIGSQQGSVEPVSQIAPSGSRVAVLLPVILEHASTERAPKYTMDVQGSAKWAEGVETRGVRTHFYTDVSQMRSSMGRTNMI